MESLQGFWALLTQIDAEQVKSLAAQNMGFALLLCFASGVLTSFTPCVYPMIPITINIFGRFSENRKSKKFDGKTFGVAAIYVLGMCFTYSVMGLIAGMTGSLFGRILQSPWVLGSLSLLFFVLALSQLGLFKIDLPGSLKTRIARIGDSNRLGGIFLMGLLSGLIVSPCVGPVIGGILAFVFESSNALKGLLYFLSFSLGLGMLFLLIGGFSGLLGRLPRSGGWMVGINRLLAVMMFLASAYYAWPIFHPASSSKGGWLTSETKAFELAKQRNVPIVVDFTAEWCAACHEIDALVFQDAAVQEAFKQFVLLRLDVTIETEETERYLKKYGVLSLPTVLFVQSTGRVMPQPRIHGVIPVPAFLKTLESVTVMQSANKP